MTDLNIPRLDYMALRLSMVDYIAAVGGWCRGGSVDGFGGGE